MVGRSSGTAQATKGSARSHPCRSAARPSDPMRSNRFPDHCISNHRAHHLLEPQRQAYVAFVLVCLCVCKAACHGAASVGSHPTLPALYTDTETTYDYHDAAALVAPTPQRHHLVVLPKETLTRHDTVLNMTSNRSMHAGTHARVRATHVHGD